jgi:hypothetical protein
MKIEIETEDWVVSQLEELKDATGSANYTELFSNALALMAWATQQRSAGRSVASIDEQAKEFRRLRMPVLEYVAFVSGHGATELKAA